jgi:hypothetical protein
MKRVKNALRKFTPLIIWKIFSLIKFFVVISNAKKMKDIRFNKVKDKIVVLGNGPSLKEDIELIDKEVDTSDFVCVNNFATSNYYERFKPTMYVFLDSYFFSKKAHDDWIRQRELTFQAIEEKTSWKMQIFLPLGADENVLSKIIKNTNVEILKIKTIGVFYKKYDRFTSFFLNTGLFGPAQNNVLLYSIYLSIWANYKKIDIYGADMTIYKNIDVNKNNDLVFKRSYFNEKDCYELLKTGPLKENSPRISNMMFSAYRIFLQHEILHEYAVSKSIFVTNRSSTSLIDSYPRTLEGEL